jgi:hypothetical protein
MKQCRFQNLSSQICSEFVLDFLQKTYFLFSQKIEIEFLNSMHFE